MIVCDFIGMVYLSLIHILSAFTIYLTSRENRRNLFYPADKTLQGFLYQLAGLSLIHISEEQAQIALYLGRAYVEDGEYDNACLLYTSPHQWRMTPAPAFHRQHRQQPYTLRYGVLHRQHYGLPYWGLLLRTPRHREHLFNRMYRQ